MEFDGNGAGMELLNESNNTECTNQNLEKIHYQKSIFILDYSLSTLILMVSFALIIFGGIFGNVYLIVSIYSSYSVRVRNPLLLAVCLADLLVTSVSVPITLLNIVMENTINMFPPFACKTLNYLQEMPVAASTMSIFILSLHRYITVKNPRIAKFRQRHYLNWSLVIFSWLNSAIINAPIFFTHKRSKICNIDISFNINTENDQAERSTYMIYIVILHTLVVFIIPGFGVLLNYYGVRQKLCALSLTARAAHGELALPMPLLRKLPCMIIVTGVIQTQKGSNKNNSKVQSAKTHIQRSSPILPRSVQEIQNETLTQNLETAVRSPYLAGTGIPLPERSTLQCRKRLANMLLVSAMIFIGCWGPHVFCVLYLNFSFKCFCSKAILYTTTLLGFAFSAINPIIYTALNHNALRQSQSPTKFYPAANPLKKFLCGKFRSHAVPSQPSSTNEAALGAFNPMLVQFTRKQYRTEASSHYLY